MDEQNSDSVEFSDIIAVLKESARGQWDVDADELLLKALITVQAKFSARFASVREEVETHYEDVRTTSIQLQNAMNSFVLLSQKQFVQNRVSLEDVESETVSEQDDAISFLSDNIQEDTEARVTRVCQEAIDLGIRVLEERTMPLFLEEMNPSEIGDTLQGEEETFSQSSANHYRNRRFLALIGSERFLSDPYCGYFEDGDKKSWGSSSSDNYTNAAVEPVLLDTQQVPVFVTGPLGNTNIVPPPPPQTTTTTTATTIQPPSVYPIVFPGKQPPPPPPPPSTRPKVLPGKEAPIPPKNSTTNLKSPSSGPILPSSAKGKKVALKPNRIMTSTLFNSSDSSDEQIGKLNLGQETKFRRRNENNFFKGNNSTDSTSDDSSEVSRLKIPAKITLQKKNVMFSDDSSSEIDKSEKRIVPPSKKAPKIFSKSKTWSDDSSYSEEEAPQVTPPPKISSNKIAPSTAPKIALQKVLPKYSSSDSDINNKNVPSSINVIQPVESETKSLSKVDYSSQQNREVSLIPANNSEVPNETIYPSPPITPVVLETKQNLAVAPAPLKAKIPLPKRGAKAISTSSSDIEEPAIVKTLTSTAPSVKNRKIPPPPPKNTGVKTVSHLYSSDSDIGVVGSGAPHAPRKIIPKMTLTKRRVFSSDSEN